MWLWNKESNTILDTLLGIENGKIELDLYRKVTDKNKYLLPSSCHPKTTTASIPYSLSLWIVRTCTSSITRDLILNELETFFLARNYPENLLDSSINRARKIPRKVALLKVRRKGGRH